MITKDWKFNMRITKPHIDPMTTCGLCGNPTRMLATKRCDRCWELETRIQAMPELARKILEKIK